MSVEYTRDPGSLSYDDYKYWIRKEVLKFLTDHAGDSDYPSHIVPSVAAFETMIDAYDAAFNPYHELIDLANKTNKSYTGAADDLAKKLQQIKYAIPTIDPDPVVLAQFDLGQEIPNDRDLLLTVAVNALAHWATVSADPKFGPIVGDFDALQVLYDDCVAKQDIYVDTEDQRQATQNSVLATREALHVTERKVFNWYRSRHPNGQDEWWTATPWGRTSGGSGGGGEEPGGEVPEIPDKPEGVYANFMTEPVIAMLVGCGKYGEHTGFDVVRAITPAGVTETPTRPEELFATNIDVINEPLLDTDIDPGYRYWYWVRARNGDEVGEWSEVVWVEYL